jgi:hypothetical protein
MASAVEKAVVAIALDVEDGEIQTASEKLAQLKARFQALDGARVQKPADDLVRVKTTADDATTALDKLRAAAKAANSAGGKGFGGSTPTALMGSAKPPSGFNQIVQAVGKLFGGGAASGLVSGAAALSRVEEKLAPLGLSLKDAGGVLTGAGSALVGAGGAVLSAGKVVLEAAAALAAAAVAVAAAGYKLGVEKTSEKQAGEAVLGKAGYAQTIQLAATYNLDEKEAGTQVKKLLNAHFSQSEIPVLIGIKAGMDLKGLNGDELLGKLETMKLKPKVDAKDIKALAGMGVDTKAVYDELAKSLGVKPAEAMAKVKAGAVDTGKVIAAVEAATSKQFGGLAEMLGNSVPGLLNKIRLAFGELFADMDLGPLKDFLKSVLGAISGGAGGELKKSLQELFAAISHTLFDPFKGAEGQKKLENMLRGMAGMLHDAAGAVRDLAPLINLLVSAFASTGKGGAEGSAALGAFEGFVMGLLGPIGDAIDALRVLSKLIGLVTGEDVGPKKPGAADPSGGPMAPSPMTPVPTDAANDNASSGGMDVGSALSDGITLGISNGEPGAIAAAVSLVTNAIAAAHAAADAHSPSRPMARLGGFLGQGVTVGMQGQNDNAADAGANIARSAMKGAAAGGGGALAAVAGPRPAGAGAGAKGGDVYNVQIQQPAGATKKEGEEFAIGFTRKLRDLRGEAA